MEEKALMDLLLYILFISWNKMITNKQASKQTNEWTDNKRKNNNYKNNKNRIWLEPQSCTCGINKSFWPCHNHVISSHDTVQVLYILTQCNALYPQYVCVIVLTLILYNSLDNMLLNSNPAKAHSKQKWYHRLAVCWDLTWWSPGQVDDFGKSYRRTGRKSRMNGQADRNFLSSLSITPVSQGQISFNTWPYCLTVTEAADQACCFTKLHWQWANQSEYRSWNAKGLAG